MSNIDKRALREEFQNMQDHYSDPADRDRQVIYIAAEALLDELEGEKGRTKELESQRALAFTAGNRWADKFRESEAKLEAAEKRIAELSHHLQCAHAFIEHTEAFGNEASNGILCCGDAQWNIDESKSALTAAGKGE